MNIFDDIPLNTQHAYVHAYTRSGCCIYVPVNVRTEAEMLEKKKELIEYLYNQPSPSKELA